MLRVITYEYDTHKKAKQGTKERKKYSKEPYPTKINPIYHTNYRINP